jgi:AraC-like DNA-binding protein
MWADYAAANSVGKLNGVKRFEKLSVLDLKRNRPHIVSFSAVIGTVCNRGAGRKGNHQCASKDVVVRRLFDGLLVTILPVYFETRKQDAGFYRGLSDTRMSRVIAAIHNAQGDSPNVSELAAIAGMSRSSFSHHFKEYVGQSAGAYATRWKRLKARTAMRETSAPIETIEIRAGYNSTSAFSRAFHRYFNVTPSEFRSTSKRHVAT